MVNSKRGPIVEISAFAVFRGLNVDLSFPFDPIGRTSLGLAIFPADDRLPEGALPCPALQAHPPKC